MAVSLLAGATRAQDEPPPAPEPAPEEVQDEEPEPAPEEPEQEPEAEPEVAPEDAPEAAAPEEPEELLFVRAERLIVRPGHALAPGQVLMRNGVIVRVGSDLAAPDGAQVIEGAVVCAGFIDPWSALGVMPSALADGNTDAASLTRDAIDWWSDEDVREEALRAGVTAARVQIGQPAFVAGIGAMVRTAPELSLDDAVILDEAALAANVGMSQEGGGQIFFDVETGTVRFETGVRAIDPFDRIAQIERLAGELEGGRKYLEDKIEYRYELEEWEKKIAEKEKELEKEFKKAKKDREKDEKKATEDGKEFKDKKYKEDKRPSEPRFDAAKETWARVVEGELPLIVHVHRSAEIRTLLEATKGFDRLRLVLAGATEAADHAAKLAERKIPVILWPVPVGKAGKGQWDEWEGHSLSLAAQLAEAGIEVLLGSGGEAPRASRDLPLYAALAVGHGLDRDRAFEALTLGAARAFDVADRLGSVEVGKVADILVLDGEPLSTTTHVRYVVVDGRVVVAP